MKNVPESGKVYVVRKPFSTLAKVDYQVGDQLTLVEPTGQAPFGALSKLCNWVVRCKHFSPPDPQSVWSNIYYMVEVGIIEAIDA